MNGLTCSGGHRHERVEGASTNASGSYSAEMVEHIMQALIGGNGYVDHGSSCSDYTTDDDGECEFYRRTMFP